MGSADRSTRKDRPDKDEKEKEKEKEKGALETRLTQLKELDEATQRHKPNKK